MSDPIDLWNDAWAVCVGDKDLTNARVSGRATKANPNKEDVTQWHKQGPVFVQDYIAWREANPNWKIWRTPDNKPAIELELEVPIGNIPIKVGIDRIFDVDGKLVIIDLKTSSSEQYLSSLQLGFYKVAIEVAYGVSITHGNFYMARKASMTDWVDLSDYTYEKLEYLVNQFDKARKSGIFIPNAASCKLCGFSKECTFSSKKEG
jgi:CRISPR/Cas system-associated exonuclease Cas4 (RecB family)